MLQGNRSGHGVVQLDCAAGGELLAWNDATLWIVLLLYLFVGIYVVCDYYFVPSLEIIGDRLKWSESIQGASLMAAGSSFPEFLTALFGVIFFSGENPGPATNIGSAIFNICIIVSFSILFLPRKPSGQPYTVHPVAFARDCGFFVLAAVESYVFFEVLSPGQLQWSETLTMTATYAVYLGSLFVTDRFVQFPTSTGTGGGGAGGSGGVELVSAAHHHVGVSNGSGSPPRLATTMLTSVHGADTMVVIADDDSEPDSDTSDGGTAAAADRFHQPTTAADHDEDGGTGSSSSSSSRSGGDEELASTPSLRRSHSSRRHHDRHSHSSPTGTSGGHSPATGGMARVVVTTTMSGHHPAGLGLGEGEGGLPMPIGSCLLYTSPVPRDRG